MVTESPPRPLDHAQRGRLGAEARWGRAPRVMRLADLTVPQRRLVAELVAALKAAQPGESV